MFSDAIFLYKLVMFLLDTRTVIVFMAGGLLIDINLVEARRAICGESEQRRGT